MDIKTKEARSRNMSAIRSKDTKPEVFFRKLLFSRGFRYRKNVSNIPGHPDLYLAKYHTAIFVHGCFWHRHKNCKYAYMPKSRTDFWNDKFEKNVKRDEEVLKQLAEKNIKCLVVWECTIRRMRKSEVISDNILLQVFNFFSSSKLYLEI